MLPITDIKHLNDINAERFQRESYLLHATADLPDSPAVRAEVMAMLENAERELPPRPRPGRRLRVWFPRWIGWLRTMPVP